MTQWHTWMFKPCVTAGIISELDLAAYRKGPITIRASRHVPPASEQLMDCMDALKACMDEEESFVVKAVLGHFIFGYIRPYFDGNGRAAWFLMNFLLVVGGYNWVIITKEARDQYLNALESASVGGGIKPFVEFINSMAKNEFAVMPAPHHRACRMLGPPRLPFLWSGILSLTARPLPTTPKLICNH